MKKKAITNVIRDAARFILRPKLYCYLRFILTHKYIPNIKSPKSFSEKILRRKFDSKSINYSKYVDKYLVREYVESTIGSTYLIPLLLEKKEITIDDIKNLPSEFVMKTSNGGGGENVLIVEDSKLLQDRLSICNKFNKDLSNKIGSKIDEYFYDIETPRIIVEKLIRDKNNRFPSDFKFHIFESYNDEEPKVFIQIDQDRFENHKRSIFNENLERVDYSIQPKYPPVTESFSLPSNIAKAIELAKKLAAPFPYVRVDMYIVGDVIYFGELTFCHGSGWERFSSKEADFLFGGYWLEY